MSRERATRVVKVTQCTFLCTYASADDQRKNSQQKLKKAYTNKTCVFGC